MEIGDLILAHHDAIGPAVLELAWIDAELRRHPFNLLLTISRCAFELRKHPKTVSHNFQRLEECGLIWRRRVRGRGYFYRVIFHN